MGVESNVNKVSDLNEEWPLVDDPVGQGDDHIRNIKKAVKKSFQDVRIKTTIAEIAEGKFNIGDLLEVSDRNNAPAKVVAGVANGYDKLEGLNGRVAAIENAGDGLSVRCLVTDMFDGATNNTTSILAWLQQLPETDRNTYIFDTGVFVELRQLVPEIPAGTVIRLENARVGNNTGTFYEKGVGYITSDLTENDTIDWVMSGHNASRGFNNFRTSQGSTSADLGRATEVWALGKVNGGQARNMGLEQWAKSSAGDWWEKTIRAEAPWVSVADKNDMWEYWVEGETITAGQYRKGTHMYVAASSGVTGSIKPVHSSGTVSDGGVDWTYVANGDATIYAMDQYGRLAANSRASNTAWQDWVMTPDDPSTTMDVYYRASKPSVKINVRYLPTNASGVKTATPFWSYDGDALSTSLQDTVGGTVFYADNSVFSVRKPMENRSSVTKRTSTAADNDTTPSVLGINTLVVSNTSPTSITAFDDSIEYQEIQVIATNGNTTLVNSGSIRLAGGVNLTMTAFTVVTLRRVAAAITSSFIEVSRSVK